MVTVSVPGKVHLMGEHAVVYGKPALLAAVHLRMRVTICKNSHPHAGGDPVIIQCDEPTEYARYAVGKVYEYFKIKNPDPIIITINSEFPAGYHLGSSAAVAVGVVAAVVYAVKKIWNPQLINQLAYEVEKKQHGNPSGGDNTAVTVGGLLWYRKETEFLKSMWQLPFSIPTTLNHFYLVNTGRPKETTKEMVALVKSKVIRQRANQKLKMDALFQRNEEQVRRIATAIKENNEQELIDAIRKGERTLEEIGVVPKKVLPCIRDVEKINGAVKILGGGGIKDGVGFLLCYHKDKKRLETIVKKYKYSFQEIQLGGEGVRLEKK